jgi:hypothetical protein
LQHKQQENARLERKESKIKMPNGLSPAPYFSAKYFCIALILTATRPHKMNPNTAGLQVVLDDTSCLQRCKLQALIKHHRTQAWQAAACMQRDVQWRWWV